MSGRFWLISVLSLMVSLLVSGTLFSDSPIEVVSSEQKTILVGESRVLVEIADEEEEMRKGLGYRDRLDSDSGMLFIYPNPGKPSFWMKGMRFDLDFIWILDGRVVELTRNVPFPENKQDQPVFIKPKEQSNWILEVNAGWIDESEVRVGNKVRFE